MSTKIFLSHASSEIEKVNEVGHLLREAGLEPVIDNEEVRTSESFISFMNEAMANCDYCLLLWSLAASKGLWVKEEWESAYYRSVTTNQNFLVIGRLEELAPPPMLRPRTWIELFPELYPGIGQLVAMWQDDEAAAEASNRPVRPPQRPLPTESSGQTVYISSKIFGKTFPFGVDFEAPTAVVTESIVDFLDAPRKQSHQGIMGCRYEYSLNDGSRFLDPLQSLKSQNVAEKSVLWLHIKITPFAVGESVGNKPTGVKFRGGRKPSRNAERELLEWSKQLGLGS